MRDFIYVGDRRPTMRAIAEAVALAHGLRAADIYRPLRQKWVAHPRQEAMARMSHAGFSHPQIVRHFGLKNHTTSVHAKQVVEARSLDYRVRLTSWTVHQIKASPGALAQQEAV